MKKTIKLKQEEKFKAMHNTSCLVVEDVDDAAQIAFDEAIASGVSPSSVMVTTPDGAVSGDK